jgi:spore germination cell wall hydrolase CwlJ-like protein
MNQAATLKRPLDGLKDRAAQLKLRAAGLWRSHPRETLGAGLLGVIVAAALGTAASSAPDGGQQAVLAAPPAPPPLLIRQIAPEQAVKVNAAIPVADGPNPAAKPFVFKGNAAAREQALQCLASAVYYEAGRESTDGQRAVAQVVLNRVRHSAFPASICGVVFEGSTRATGCQFSFTCDGSLYRQPDAAHWRRAHEVAQAAMSGAVHAPVGNATHYHANYVVPYWASSLAKNAVIGAHIFYRWNGGWGQPAAFRKAYAGREPNMLALRSAALAAEAATAKLAQDTLTPGSVAEAVEDIPGAEALPLVPSMRGDKRVAVRFNLAAREATEKLAPEQYVEKVKASDNLKWALSGDPTAAAEKPLGKAADAAPASVPAGATGQR